MNDSVCKLSLTGQLHHYSHLCQTAVYSRYWLHTAVQCSSRHPCQRLGQVTHCHLHNQVTQLSDVLAGQLRQALRLNVCRCWQVQLDDSTCWESILWQGVWYHHHQRQVTSRTTTAGCRRPTVSCCCTQVTQVTECCCTQVTCHILMQAYC